MPDPNLLETFLQISDLHLDPQSSASGPPRLPTLYPVHQIFDGFLGHHSVALGALEDFFYDLCATEHPTVIVTGDLSRNGLPAQLTMAENFLGNTVTVPNRSKPAGLRHKAWQTLSIYGNHDHFPGVDFPLGHAAANLSNYLHRTPSISRVRLKSGRSILFLRIDSDVDVNPISLERFLGVAAFESELSVLSQRLRAYHESEIRSHDNAPLSNLHLYSMAWFTIREA